MWHARFPRNNQITDKIIWHRGSADAAKRSPFVSCHCFVVKISFVILYEVVYEFSRYARIVDAFGQIQPLCWREASSSILNWEGISVATSVLLQWLKITIKSHTLVCYEFRVNYAKFYGIHGKFVIISSDRFPCRRLYWSIEIPIQTQGKITKGQSPYKPC